MPLLQLPRLMNSMLALFFHQEAIVLDELKNNVIMPLNSLNCEFSPDNQFYLGQHAGQPLYAVHIEPHHLLATPHLILVPARKVLTLVTDLALCDLICRAKQSLYWHRRSLYCGQCGEHTQIDDNERCKYCNNCQTRYYPTTAPAIIVAITRADEVLLARSPHFAPNMYSALAGFIEAGESCEKTIAREVFEEVGLYVTNIRYFGSQSWPFPNSFMLGFIADYADGEIIINTDEIEDAQWFKHNSLPLLPPPYSIARRLIEYAGLQ